MKPQAYSPASLSFIFQEVKNKDIIKSGSIGIGCTIDSGVFAQISKGSKKTKIYFNNSKLHFPTVLYVVNKLINVACEVQLKSDLPLGCGFGLSSASSLATAWAINKVFSLKKTSFELAALAHKSEILNKSGLGSVATQYRGGFLVKTRAGLPVLASTLPFTGKILYCLLFGKLLTSKILKDKLLLLSINKNAHQALLKINKLKKPTLENIFDIALISTTDCGFLNNMRMQKFVNKTKKIGGSITCALLGKMLISTKIPEIDKSVKLIKVRVTDDTVKLL